MFVRIRQTQVFGSWLSGLKDLTVRAAVVRRIVRLAADNAGDMASVGDGVSELRIHLGAGWRIYFVQRRGDLIILLVGGSKRTQARDIVRAKALAADPDLEQEAQVHEP